MPEIQTGQGEAVPDAASLAPQSTVTAAELQGLNAHDTRSRSTRGYLLLGTTAAAAAAIWWGSDTEGKITIDAPFIPVAQEAIEAVDSLMANAGAPLFVGAATTLAGAKIAGRWSPNIREADRASSKELSDDGKRDPNAARRLLQNYAAGSVPVIASSAVALSAIMAGVGYEISEGPTRPIEYMIDSVPSDGPISIIVQDAAANPMVESKITSGANGLTERIRNVAAESGILATPIDMNLAPMNYGGQKLTALVFAAEDVAGDSPLSYDPVAEGCGTIPIAMDESARIPNGKKVRLNGYNAEVVSQIEGASAINRIGIKVAPEVLATCLDKNPQAPHDFIVVTADVSKARDILSEANAELDEPAAVITEQQFIKNSEDFWEANSKPITNVLTLMSTGVAVLSMAGINYARLLRNRRNWATNLAQGVTDSQLRMTELLRATKDGVVASVVGVAASFAAPAINFLESGLKVGVDYRTTMIGFTVGVFGSLSGTLIKVLRPRKVISIAEDTRV